LSKFIVLIERGVFIFFIFWN